MSEAAPAIEFDNLQKHFGKGEDLIKAVDGVSLEVPRGEIFGFLGPNGAGKTTAIRCIMDFIRPTGGSIRILGKDAQKNSVELNHDLGYLSGYVQLYKKWTGAEHIRYFSKLNGGAPAAEKLVKRLDFDPTLKAKKLSSGNKQKLGIVLALMHEPNLLIMDEPTNALDPLLQQVVYELLEEARERGATVFMSSHNLPEVERVCSSVAIIRDGKLVAQESIDTLHEKRLYTVKARFHSSIQKSDLDLENVTVHSIEEKRVELRIKSDIAPILKKITELPLDDVQVHHASLEEIFMEYYEI